MLKAVFKKENGKFCICSVKGHAGYADNGQDVVCAAVSSAVQLTANLITETLHEPAEVSVRADMVTIRLKKECTVIAASVIEALYIHLQYISEDFPGTIQFEISEV
jgi:uncharacterized protein YsxB (DUF464 family)